MSADIFISFASQDSKVARTICTALENRGFTCWISARNIQPGENFQSAIVRAIRGAKVLLLVFTANSNHSEEMTKELALASQQKLMVVPLRVENVDPSDAFAYEFATRQWIDLFADWEHAMNNLCARLTAALSDDRTHVDTIVLGKPSLQDPKAKPSPASQKKRVVAIVALVVVLVGSVAGLLLSGSKPSAQAATQASGNAATGQTAAIATVVIAAPATPGAPDATTSTSTAALSPQGAGDLPAADAPKPKPKPRKNLPY
jgi:TIR domain